MYPCTISDQFIAVLLLIFRFVVSLAITSMSPHVLRIAAWNMRGTSVSMPYLNNLMERFDIVAKSEHKLYNCQLSQLDHINQSLISHAKSSNHLNDIGRDECMV